MQVAKLAGPTVLMACALSGCVVAPYGPRAYGPRAYGPSVYVEPSVMVAPAPVLVVPRPYDRPDWRYGRGGPHWRDRDGRDHRR